MNDNRLIRVDVGDTLNDHYRIVRRVGEGGMSVVFEAENTRTHRRVAVKVLRVGPVADVAAVERFKREAQVAVRIAHPNVIDVLDLERDARTGSLYLVQELLRGRDLRSLLDERKRLAPAEALAVMRPVMAALVAAHRQGVLHRDVKPENIFLAETPQGETVKLIDFGVSKVLASSSSAGRATSPGAPVGTLCYMAPEQVRGDAAVDARVDVWAVGAVLFELLAGRPPFEAEHSHQLILKIAQGSPPLLGTVAPEVPSVLAAVVDRALQPDRERRFATMQELLDALDAPDAPRVRADDLTLRPPPPDRVRLLLVDDDDGVRRTVARVLSRYEVVSVADGDEALPLLAPPADFALVITDLTMPRVNGMEVVRAAARAGVPAIMITANPTVDNAVQAMRLGAVNFIPKPFTNEALRGAVTDVLAARSVSSVASEEVVGSDPGFRAVLDLVDVVAGTDATVLLTGETGTGKGVVARLIHRLSPRGHGPFVTVDAGAIPEAAVEAELFGRGGGAPGLVQQADGGTLFFDEVGEMPLACQAKILRLVQEHTYGVAGEARPRKADVRILAATHRDLGECVRRGEFRADLFFRLSVVSLPLPPLRDRRGDIPDLVARFMATASRESRRPVQGIDDDAVAALSAHGWPGNVRELQNAVTRLVLFARGGRVALADAQRELRGSLSSSPPPSTSPPPQAREQFEADVILQAIERGVGASGAGSKLAGVDRATLVAWLLGRSGAGG